MADYDVYNGGGIVHNTISAERAREVYEAAAADPDSDLDGDLENGFHYWTKNADGVELVRHHVMPRNPDAEPEGPCLPPGSV